MITYCTGNMWDVYDEVGMFVITTNSTVTNDGRLVMGRGIALEARNRFPGIDAVMGKALRDSIPNCGFYGFRTDQGLGTKLGFLQTKHYFGTCSKPILIAQSLALLKEYLVHHPDMSIALNMPGVGNGKLGRHSAIALVHVLEGLPNLIQIWEYKIQSWEKQSQQLRLIK